MKSYFCVSSEAYSITRNRSFIDLIVILRENPGSSKFIGEAMRKGKQEFFDAIHEAKCEDDSNEETNN